MISKYSTGSLCLLLCLLPRLQPAARAADLKIATVSMERLFDEYHKTKTANAQFKARADEVDIKRRELIADAKSLKSELESLAAEARDKSLSAIERDKKKAQAEDKYLKAREAEEKLMEFDKTCKQQFGEQMRQMQQQIVVEIRNVIKEYIKDRGITLVLDSSGKTMNNVESVLYSDKSYDITDPILAILNKDAKPEAASTPATPTKK